MAFNLPGIPFQATSTGTPDYGQALRSGFQTYNEGVDSSYKPKNMAEALLARQLENKMNRAKADYAQPMAEAELGLRQAQLRQAGQPSPATGELAQLFKLRESFPEGSPDRASVESVIANKSAGGQGTTVFDPTSGNPLVKIGGSASSRGTGGATYMNPQTGAITSAPTTGTATNLQGRVVGGEALKPYIGKIIETLPQFQDPMTHASLLGQKLANALGGQNFPLPSQKAGGKAAIKEASEGMIKTFGLNATGANRQAMEDILAPQFGESPQGYASRVQEQAGAYADNQQLAKDALGGGIKVGSSRPSVDQVPAGKIRVFFPDGPHIIPDRLLADAQRAGATLEGGR